MMRSLLPIFVGCFLSVASMHAYEGQLQRGDRLLVTSHQPDALFTVNREGEVLWRSDLELKHPQQVSPLPDGRVLCATIDGAQMLKADGSIAWTYSVPDGAENASALFLDAGRYLVAHEGPGELVELNDQGELAEITKVQPITNKVHGQFRYLGYGDGNYLVPMTNGSTFREIEPNSGQVVWEISGLKLVTSALRRADGGTYICHKDTITSYDSSRNVEWAVTFTKDLGFAKSVPPTGMIQLPGGHLIIAFWHGHTDVPDVIEFDPVHQKLVHQWDIAGMKRIGCVALLPEGHTFMAAE